jgi:hypothetical protein
MSVKSTKGAWILVETLAGLAGADSYRLTFERVTFGMEAP